MANQKFFVQKQFHNKPVKVYDPVTKTQKSVTLNKNATDGDIQGYIRAGVDISHFGENEGVNTNVNLKSLEKKRNSTRRRLTEVKRVKTELVTAPGYGDLQGQTKEVIVEKVVYKRDQKDVDELALLRFQLKMGSENAETSKAIFEKEKEKLTKKDLDLVSSVFAEGKKLSKDEAYHYIHSVN